MEPKPHNYFIFEMAPSPADVVALPEIDDWPSACDPDSLSPGNSLLHTGSG